MPPMWVGHLWWWQWCQGNNADNVENDDADDDKMTKKQSGPCLAHDVCENHLNCDEYENDMFWWFWLWCWCWWWWRRWWQDDEETERSPLGAWRTKLPHNLRNIIIVVFTIIRRNIIIIVPIVIIASIVIIVVLVMIIRGSITFTNNSLMWECIHCVPFTLHHSRTECITLPPSPHSMWNKLRGIVAYIHWALYKKHFNARSITHRDNVLFSYKCTCI